MQRIFFLSFMRSFCTRFKSGNLTFKVFGLFVVESTLFSWYYTRFKVTLSTTNNILIYIWILNILFFITKLMSLRLLSWLPISDGNVSISFNVFFSFTDKLVLQPEIGATLFELEVNMQCLGSSTTSWWKHFQAPTQHLHSA